MRRMGLAGLLFAATVAVPGAVAPGLAPAAAPPAGDGSARTGDLIALVRSPRIAVAIEPSKRESLLDTTRRRISAVIARSGVSAVRSIPELGAVAVRPAPGDSLGRARRELQADPAVNKVEVEHFRTLRYLPDDPALADHDALAPSHDFYQWNLRQEHFPERLEAHPRREGADSQSSTPAWTAPIPICRGGSPTRRATTTPVAVDDFSHRVRGRSTMRWGMAPTSPGWRAARATTAWGSPAPPSPAS